jgi:hypothetical protein
VADGKFDSPNIPEKCYIVFIKENDMSASREILCEKISVYEAALAEAERKGETADYIRTELEILRAQLEVANKTLTEGRSILKG